MQETSFEISDMEDATMVLPPQGHNKRVSSFGSKQLWKRSVPAALFLLLVVAAAVIGLTVGLDDKNNNNKVQQQVQEEEKKASTDRRLQDLSDEEWDLRCRAYLATFSQTQLDQMTQYGWNCIMHTLMDGDPGGPCNCYPGIIPDDFVVPECFDDGYPWKLGGGLPMFNRQPTSAPSPAPSAPCGASLIPTAKPTKSSAPSISAAPTGTPSQEPTPNPTPEPTKKKRPRNGLFARFP